MDFDLRDLPTREALQEFSMRIPEIDIRATEAMLFFMRVSSSTFKVSFEGFEKFGISHGKFSVLILLYRNTNTGLMATELAEKVGISKPTVTGLIDRLERDGFVIRQSHPSDRRMSIVKLTDQGTELMEWLLPVHFTSTSKLMSHLSTDEKELLLTLLQKIELGIPQAQEIYKKAKP
ncbi:MarR family transcriptional regulator [Paenibacillus sp. 28ISP30-2]|uniref:MarR family winged helix-turn-helix transcriptional regulator n=1 Tax=Paenibacillus sp. IHB B 3084 TaxID=867076 RepID=UPI000721C179|nr:MarR family transcriptional regulator [Paenibacillus sp. IHB B 3084]ALP37481.1 MarR family transcriptional regulator [Paenibacillus sp. IHB B 3084]MBE0341237.1 MarR family transcriptional regulator [Paenibacillus sp. 28ISP30-2]